MTFPDTVTFDTPLMARAVAQDWASVEHQLSATIGSIYNQTDLNFRIILACTDKSALNVATDGRLEFSALRTNAGGRPHHFYHRRGPPAPRIGRAMAGRIVLDRVLTASPLHSDIN
jgi:hypothetical protein